MFAQGILEEQGDLNGFCMDLRQEHANESPSSEGTKGTEGEMAFLKKRLCFLRFFNVMVYVLFVILALIH